MGEVLPGLEYCDCGLSERRDGGFASSASYLARRRAFSSAAVRGREFVGTNDDAVAVGGTGGGLARALDEMEPVRGGGVGVTLDWLLDETST